MLIACVLDRAIGDPRWSPHPVVLMGWCIARLRALAECWAGDDPWGLRLAGGVITLLLVGGSASAGWALNALVALAPAGSALHGCALVLVVMALASALAGRSLEQAVQQVLSALASGDLVLARRQLAWFVGRDTETLSEAEVLRALAETASENAVDGLFAPLFWMLVGAAFGQPLALAWGFKAASTLDSMLGYRTGRLRWLGTAGARLDDLLVWLPCRLVALSLGQLRPALRDGAPDPSPNAGVSQAAYAHAAGVQLGGLNQYGGAQRAKPLLAAGSPAPDAASVQGILQLSRRVQLLWLLLGALLCAFITKALS
ncbi:MAG: adenosylcobinamide-phosphate synthase CbiB [Cyanobacteriota bacterium]|nr:adenosylcobinamide-phosphate synthase CbiB [Cyanobacteriota bacterium]